MFDRMRLRFRDHIQANSGRDIRIVAILAVRNEGAYLRRCLRHLHSQGVFSYVIDNASTDDTKEILADCRDLGVIGVENHPFAGFFDLVGQMKRKEQIAREIKADWFIHHDTDEIMEPPKPYATLKQAISAVDAAGDNAINLDEFVFLPINEDAHSLESDYLERMQHYYFFEPAPMRLVRIWRRDRNVKLHDSGGHGAVFDRRNVHEIPFILRHYIGLSSNYLREKYARRVYSEREVRDRGWHGWRAEFSKYKVVLPNAAQLKICRNDGVWDKSDPKTSHQFIVRVADA